MADLKRHLWEIPSLVAWRAGTVTADHAFASWPATNVITDSFDGNGWLVQTPVYPEHIKNDLGAAFTMDRLLIYASSVGARTLKAVDLEYSSDDFASDVNVAWSSADPFVAGTTGRFILVSFTPASARYWRLKITSNYGDVTFMGCSGWFLWDSTELGAEVLSGATGTYIYTGGASSIANLTDHWQSGWGWYAAFSGALEVDFGAVKTVGGLLALTYQIASQYSFESLRVFRSDTGLADSWKLIVEFDDYDLRLAAGNSRYMPYDFGVPVKARYLRFEGDCYDKPAFPSNGHLSWEWLMYEVASTPAAPPVPTAVLAAAGAADPSAIHVRWTQAAGDDNPADFIVWDLERRKDGGAWGDVATGLVAAQYIDSGLAAGSYEYRVTARSKAHAEESAAVAAAVAVTVPATAGGGGGGGGPLERGLAG